MPRELLYSFPFLPSRRILYSLAPAPFAIPWASPVQAHYLKAFLLSPSLGALQFLSLGSQAKLPYSRLLVGNLSPLPRIQKFPQLFPPGRSQPLLSPPASLLLSARSPAPRFTQHAGSRAVPLASPSPQLSPVPSAVPSSLSLAAAPERAVVLVEWGRSRFGGSVGVGVSVTAQVVFCSLFRSLCFSNRLSV